MSTISSDFFEKIHQKMQVGIFQWDCFVLLDNTILYKRDSKEALLSVFLLG